jgi:hypothetical protein
MTLSFSDDVTGPDDAGYEEARRLFAGNFDKRPAVIVGPIDAQGGGSGVVFLAPPPPQNRSRSRPPPTPFDLRTSVHRRPR